MYGLEHATLQLEEPFLDLAAGLNSGDDVQQLYHLPLAALHVRDVHNFGEHNTSDALETLLQMRLHSGGRIIKKRLIYYLFFVTSCRSMYTTTIME